MSTTAHRKSTAIDDDRVLQALLSSPSTVLVGARLDGTIDRWSPGAALLYGWTADEVVGRPLATLIPPDRLAEAELARRLAAGEDVPRFETVRLHRDGSSIPVELHLVLLRDDAGSPAGTLALHRDLRDAHRLQQALRERDEELRARFQDSPVPQSRVHLDGRIVETNRALQELLGRSARELEGRDAVALFAEEARPAVRAALKQLMLHEVTSMAQEHDVLHANGSRLRLVTSVSLVHDAEGRPLLAAAVEDVTALRESEKLARLEAARYEALLQSMPVAVFTYDLDGRCTSSRGQALTTLGYRDNELVGVDLPHMYEDHPEVKAALLAPLSGGEGRALGTAEGHEWKGHYRPLRDASGAVVGGIGIAVDVTELVTAERDLRSSEGRLASLLQHATDLALVVDSQGLVSYASPAVHGLLGYAPEQVTGRSAWEFDHPDDHHVVQSALREIAGRPGGTSCFECRVLHADGTWRWADHVLTNLVHDPAVRGVVVNIRETTERRRQEEELRRLAVRDALTGLANRTLLLDRVDQSLAAGQRTGAVPGLIVLDVVAMSELNEQLGQTGGDQVLRTLAARLEAAVRAGDSPARVGGDELAVLVEDVASAEDLRALASSLLEIAEEPVDVAGSQVCVRMQAGSSLGPAADAGALLAAAEQAIPHDTGSRRVVVLSASTDTGAAAAHAGSVERLREAIGDGELVLHFQPVVRLASQEAVGAEGLVRWRHPARGLLSPSQFIPLAEQSGLVVQLGEWVLREAVTRIAHWQQAGRDLSVAVNLSPRQLVGSNVVDCVASLLEELAIRPELLVLEVTESALMDDPDAPDVLRALRGLGVKLALDDFGTGYSSLTYLKRFPVDAIKIDRSFVSGLGRDPDDEAIVTSVVSLARAVGKLVVAEGVETVAQLDALRALGVDQAQGFLWSRALPGEEIDTWLAAHRPAGTPVVTPAPRPPRPTAAAAGDSDEQRIMVLHSEGASLHTIAAALNAEGRRTPAGPRWTTKTVARAIAGMLSP